MNDIPSGQPRYVTYHRVSTPAQVQRGLSLESQEAVTSAFVKKMQGRLIAAFTEGQSGRKNDRPKFTEALRLCRLYGATLLIARLDRLSRSAALIAKLAESATDFIVLDFPCANRFTIHILAAVAEYELTLNSRRLKAAWSAKKARGLKLGEHLHRFRVHRPTDLDAARAARRCREKERAMAFAPLLRELRDRGRCLYAIADDLTRMEIETLGGAARWSRSSVRALFIRCGESLPPDGRRLRAA